MKKILISSILAVSLLHSFDFGGLVESVTKSVTSTDSSSTVTKQSLSNETITSGLKEALRVGVKYGVYELSKENGYLNNKDVKIPLPNDLQKVESLIRAAGGDKIADNLIVSMNKAATQAAPKTADIFLNAINEMSMDDALRILNGKNDKATQYFREKTTDNLVKSIKPIVQDIMKESDVASYYDTFNEYYKTYAKDMVKSSSLMDMANSFGAGNYIPQGSDVKLDDYITTQAIEGLFKMIATKESDIRDNPLSQTSDILKQVFGN